MGSRTLSCEELDSSKTNKYALKLLGIDNITFTDEEVLEFLSTYIAPKNISALLFDLYNNFYVIFLLDIESVCLLVGKQLIFGIHTVIVLPLLDFYIINNVYPSVSNEDIADVFRTFGNVYEVKNYKVSPNSSKFSHILSGKREITFILPGTEKEVMLPKNIISLPYTFHVSKLCCACLTEGHSMLFCPDRDDTVLPQNNLSNHDDIIDEMSDKNENSDLSTVFKEEVNADPGLGCSQDSNYLPPKSEESVLENEFSYKGNAADFVLTSDVEIMLKDCQGVLSANILRNILSMDGRNKKEILAYVSRFTTNYQAVYDQMKELQIHCIQNETILRTVGHRLVSKLVLLMNTLLKHKNKQTCK